MQEDNYEIKDEKELKLMKILISIRAAPIFRQVLVAIGPIFITVVIGMAEGYTAILLPQLKHDNITVDINEDLSSLIAATPGLAIVIGCFLGGYLMDKIGRKPVHIWSCVIISLGWIIVGTTSNLSLILIGRSLCGLGDGLLAPSTSVYLSETTQSNTRGVLLMSITVASTTGILFVHLLAAFATWQITALVCGIIPIPLAILMLFVPESPFFLLKGGKENEAKRVFNWCRGTSDASRQELEAMVQRQRLLNNSTDLPFWQRARKLTESEFWKPILILFVLSFTSQSTGDGAVMSYTIQILQESCLNDEYLAMITMDLVRVAATMLSCILISKMSRRSLAMTSGYGASLTLCLLWCYLYISPKFHVTLPFVIMVLLIAYLCFIYVGLIPLTWTLMGELFPLDNKDVGTAISSGIDFILFDLVIFSFPYVRTLFSNISFVFLCYSACVLFGTIYLTLFLPETKDKPLHIIDNYFRSPE